MHRTNQILIQIKSHPIKSRLNHLNAVTAQHTQGLFYESDWFQINAYRFNVFVAIDFLLMEVGTDVSEPSQQELNQISMFKTFEIIIC